jgi:hypothetical protein
MKLFFHGLLFLFSISHVWAFNQTELTSLKESFAEERVMCSSEALFHDPQNIVQLDVRRLQGAESFREVTLYNISKKTIIFQKKLLLLPLNFRQSQLDFSEAPFPLSTLSCFIGPKSFFYEHASDRDLFIHNHVQESFFRYDRGFSFAYQKLWQKIPATFEHLVLSNAPLVSELSTAIEVEKVQSNLARLSDSFIEKNERTSYRLSPSGNIHLRLPRHYQGNIFITGTAFNYCLVNLLASLGRALLEADIRELPLFFVDDFIFFQKLGLTDQLHIKWPEGLYSLEHKTLHYLRKNAPSLYEKNFQQQKKIIESLLEEKIEIVRKGDHVNDPRKPRLVIHHVSSLF